MFSAKKYVYERTSSTDFSGSKCVISNSIKILLIVVIIGCLTKTIVNYNRRIAIAQIPIISASVDEVNSGLNEVSLSDSEAELSISGIKSYLTSNLKTVERIFASGIR